VDKVSSTIAQSVQDFLDQLSVGKQPNTVKAYGVTLRRFERFLAEEYDLPSNVIAQRLAVDHAITFAKSLHELAPATVRNYLAAMSEFYRYLFAKRLVDADTADHERLFMSLKQMRPRSSTLPHVPPDDVISALVEAAMAETEALTSKRTPGDSERARLRSLRDVALLLALKSSGMRLGEALALRRGDLDYRNKSALVTGKGRKQRIVYFDDAAWNAIQLYLQERHDGSRSRALAQNPIFARHDRRVGKDILPLTHQRVEQIFADLAARSKIDPPPTPHWLRHWFATRVLDRTQDLAALQDMLGHASPVTTRIYAKVSSKRLREVHDVAFDKNREKR
jgi:site-specific recombinase XerD